MRRITLPSLCIIGLLSACEDPTGGHHHGAFFPPLGLSKEAQAFDARTGHGAYAPHAPSDQTGHFDVPLDEVVFDDAVGFLATSDHTNTPLAGASAHPFTDIAAPRH